MHVNGNLRIVINLIHDAGGRRYAREPDPIEPVIFPIDITTTTAETKLIAVAMRKAAEAFFDRGYLARDGAGHKPNVIIQMFNNGEWHETAL